MNQFLKAKMGFYKVMIECDANLSLFEFLNFFFFFCTIYESHYIIQLVFNFFFLSIHLRK